MKHYVYSKRYYADLGEAHPFPSEKYRLLHEYCLREGLIDEAEVAEPSFVGRRNLLLVHTEDYLDRLARIANSGEGIVSNGENPISEEICAAAELVCGGSYLAGSLALAGGFAMSFSGGFHHAFPDHEEGFCYFNDVAVAIRMLQAEGKLAKALVVDCDLHQGNGTAYIFRDDETVFTASIHQEDNYPVKEKSDLDVGLYGKATSDREYLQALAGMLERLPGAAQGYEACFYIAGADPYERDSLGGFSVSMPALRKRDAMLVEFCQRENLPLVVTLAGGYSEVSEVVRIHANSLREGKKLIKAGRPTR